MTRIYGHKWTSSFGESDDGTWLKGLQDLPLEMIREGLECCLTQTDTWPPTLPEFRQLCIGVPDMMVVVNKAITGKANDDVSREIARLIGSWDLNRLSTIDLTRLGKSHYKNIIDRMMSEKIEKNKQLSQDKKPELIGISGRK